MAAIERVAAEVLPEGMGLEWTDLAYQEKRAGNESIYIFALCVLFVFLILAALYESWSLPLSIILIVPLVLLFALLGMDVRGIDNNLMGQIGKTTYIVRVHFSQTAKETMEDKIKRLLREEVRRM